MSVRAIVTVGIGAWSVTKEIKLIACPHVGDMVVIGENVITCERVYIGTDRVHIEETRRFQSEQDAKDFFK